MQLMISSNDMRRLSHECRKELITLLMSRVPDDFGNRSAAEAEPTADQKSGASDDAPTDQAIGMFREVDLTVAQAQKLMANINEEKAQPTLKKLATGKQIPKSELHGTGNAKDFGLQVIGAVNRRLRNITGAPNANLFQYDSTTKKIYVSEKTAQSLRVVFELPEPLPLTGFYKRVGDDEVSETEVEPVLLGRLEQAWSGFSLRPGEVSPRVWFESVHSQLAKSGLQLIGSSFHDYVEATGALKVSLSHLTEPVEKLYEFCQKYEIDTFYYAFDANSPVVARINTNVD